jgi:hypothetical protein
VTWLLDHDAEVSGRGRVHPFDDIEQRVRGDVGQTPLDAAASQVGLWGEDGDSLLRFGAVADLLVKRGAEMTARGAVALGNAEWLRARNAEGALTNRIDETGGLLRIAVSHNRPEILALLLGFGFDPDERTRFRDVGVDDVVFTWGMPLWHCAGSGKYDMAEMLLARGADPNGDVYASGTPVSEAFAQGDSKMFELLERYGGRMEPWLAAGYRQVDRVEAMMARSSDKRGLAEQILGPAAGGGSPEIVRLALEHITWPRDDARWFGVLDQPLRLSLHGARRGRPDWDRTTYLTCFRMILERCDPNIRGRNADGSPFGLTILHSIAGSRNHVTAEERAAFATTLLDAGARLDLRDQILRSTPLGWACRWGRMELVRLYLNRAADPVEADAEPWATPLAWARKNGHGEIELALCQAGAR